MNNKFLFFVSLLTFSLESSTLFAADTKNLKRSNSSSSTEYTSVEKKRRIEAEVATKNKITILKNKISIKSFDNFDKKIIDNKNTFVFIDIDKTILRDKYWLFNFHSSHRRKFFELFTKSDLYNPNNRKAKAFANYATEAIFSESVCVEESLFDLLNVKNAIFVGLTARPFRAADWTEDVLLGLGIDFKVIPELVFYQDGFFDKDGFQKGIYYTGDAYTKLEIIPGLVELLSRRLKLQGDFHAFLIDDDQDQIDAFTKSIELDEVNFNLTITPCHYIACTNKMAEFYKNPSLIFNELSEIQSMFENDKEDR